METSEEKIEKRKEKVKSWLKNPYNLAIVGILILGFAIRLYYFFLTSNQTMWHDEAEYAAMAKHFLGDVQYNLNPQRVFLFSGVIALFFKLNLTEPAIRFFLVLIPSTLLILFVYLLGKEMFNEKIAVISAILTSVSWTLLFWTARFQPDSISLCFQVLAILFMWKFWKNEKTSSIVYSAVFASLGFMFKVSGMLVPAIFFVFIVLKDRLSMFKNKKYWIFLFVFIVTLIPQFIYSYIAFKNPLALFGTTYMTAVTAKIPFGWYNVKFYYLFTENILFWLFILGIFLALKFILYLDVLIKSKEKIYDSSIFSLLLFLIISSYYIFYIKGTDDRWVFLWLPFIFFIIGQSLVFIYSSIKKYSKLFAIVVVIILLSYGAYSQFSHADAIIKNKKDTYSQVRDAAFWIKENSDKNDVVVSASYPQTVFYSERKVVYYRPGFDNATAFESFLEKDKPRFMVVSVFEYHEPWIFEWTQKNSNRLEVKRAYFADQEQKQAILILYEIKYSQI